MRTPKAPRQKKGRKDVRTHKIGRPTKKMSDELQGEFDQGQITALKHLIESKGQEFGASVVDENEVGEKRLFFSVRNRAHFRAILGKFIRYSTTIIFIMCYS